MFPIPFVMGSVSDPLETLFSHLCYYAKFDHSRSNHTSIIMEICHKNMTFASQFSRSLDGTSTDQSATYDFLLVIQVTTGLPPTCTEINGDFS